MLERRRFNSYVARRDSQLSMIVIQSGSVIEYLRSSAISGRNSKRLLILPDGIAMQNFERAVVREGIATSADPITIDELAKSILSEVGKAGRILDSNILGRIAKDEVAHLPVLHDLLANEDAMGMFVNEFDEYLRCTDAGDLNQELIDAAKNIPDQFISEGSAHSIDLYNQLAGKLLAKIPSASPPIYLSRTHVVRTAREAIEAGWPKVLDVDEVLVASISVFDAPTLKFLVKISETGTEKESTFRLRFFLGPGTYGGFKKRIEALGAAFEEAQASPTFTSAQLKGHFLAGDMEFIATPEKRREVEEVARKIRGLLLAGTSPSKILVAARTSGKYLHLVDEIFSAYDIPYHVQTRRPYAHTSAYRFVKATLDLLVAAGAGDVDWKDITDPIRLGFCLPLRDGRWPIQSLEFTYLEERLSWIQHRKGGGPKTIADWKVAVGTIRWAHPKVMLTRFLDWVEKRLQDPPTSAEDAQSLISGMLGNYMFQVSVVTERFLSPRALPPGRFVLYDDHATRHATEIRRDLSRVEAYIKDSMTTLGASPDWSLISRAFGEVFGSESYGLGEKDLSAIRIVDVGNSSFYQTDTLILMGMQVDEFPRKNPESTFLPDALREAIDTPVKGKASYLYLRSAANDYANECDFLDLALMSGAKRVICSMSYLDEEGRAVDWSSFVDVLGPLGQSLRRVSPDDWLPTPTPGNTWSQVVADLPPWTRERLYCFHSNRAFPQLAPSITASGLAQISSSIDPAPYGVHIAPRVERFLHPPEVVTVDASESWFSTFALSDVVGSPLRSHELDVHANCPLQFYFYQFLFRWRGTSIDRDTIPPYSRRPNWRYGRIPRKISYIYPPSRTEVNVIQAVLARYPHRQPDLRGITSSSSLRATSGGILDDYGFSQFERVDYDERSLVRQETADNISRDWSWVASSPTATLALSTGVSVVLPSHRLDTLQGSKMVVSYVNFSGQIDNEVRGVHYTNEELRGIYDPLRDHRLPILLAHYSKLGKVAAGLFVELYSGNRGGYYLHDLLGKHKGANGYSEELEMPWRSIEESRKQVYEKSDWTTLLSQFETSLQRRASAMIPNPNATFQSDPKPAQCNDCVYKDLCQIPRARGF